MRIQGSELSWLKLLSGWSRRAGVRSRHFAELQFIPIGCPTTSRRTRVQLGDASAFLSCAASPKTQTNSRPARRGVSAGALAQVWGGIPSKRKLAVVDACYSGGLRMTKSTVAPEKRLSRPQLNALSDGEGSVLISSSRSVEPSLILERDSTSLFTKHLANGLLGHGDHDEDGFVRVFDLFNYVAIEVRHEAPGQSPVYAAYHQDQNFAVACCVDAARRKKRTPLTGMAANGDRLQAITAVFSSLYPLGPTDQAIWERAGGDLSRLTLSGQGRADWFRAIQLLDRGGGSLTIEGLCREALSDYPRNHDLEHL